ncbi:unnamed protein product [Rotaria sp. Silwood1]|nr:unnamed protein product [Rotaria sp. Silwood1]CAF3810080.1 unnamed protein product [Rotaria sp. Silwood1]CAF3843957.1 unnamed protein product [Rotaria sp. Silwood1]CAF4709104.1 unnamed protein product [Rotaria sp. Silwood1]CAF4993739.1 unnamed protein product [Rotaria sp. Silwood1]
MIIILHQLHKKEFIQQTTKSSSIILRNNNLISIGIKILVDGIIVSKLKYLSLSYNSNIDDQSIEHLICLLKISRTIGVLAISNTRISEDSSVLM